MEAGKARVEDEPSVEEAHVIISVWNCTIRLKLRLFREDATFLQVYDWIGSLSTGPQYFCVMDHKGAVISPDNELYSGAFNIFFRGFTPCKAEQSLHAIPYMLLPTCCYLHVTDSVDMAELEKPVPMSPKGTIAFEDFGTLQNQV